MFLIDVIPLTYIPKENSQILSYFSPQKLEKGSLVLVSLKKRKIPAIVVSSTSIKDSKTFLKKASYSIKEIESTLSTTPIFPEYFFELAKWTADFYLTSLTNAFVSILPPNKQIISLLKNKQELKKTKKEKSSSQLRKTEKLSLLKNLFSEILKTIKETGNQQILILVPTNIFAENLKELFENTNIPVSLTTDFSVKNFTNLWWQLLKGNPAVIIGQQKALFLPYTNLKHILIIEPENYLYKNSENKPFLDLREIALKIAELTNAKVSLLPLVKNQYFSQNTKKTKKYTLDLREEKKDSPVFSEKVISKLTKPKTKWLIFVNRKGHSRYIICKDCKQTINCPNCSVPLSLHKEDREKSYLLCHHCGYKAPVPERCPVCGGYLLEAKGIGVQKVFESIPFNKKIIFDQDHLKTVKQEKTAINDILNSKYQYIIATELFLKWFFLFEKFFDGSLITSFEAFLSFPDFETTEKILLQIEKLKFISKNLYIQTYNPNSKIIKTNYPDFIKEEEKIREDLNLPSPFILRERTAPLSKIIKLRIQKKSAAFAKNQAAIAKKILEKNKLIVLGPIPSFPFKEKGLYRYELLVKIKDKEEKNRVKKIIPSKDWIINVL